MSSETEQIIITCSACGTVMSDDYIDYYSGCNEEGEDYGVVSCTCPKCDKNWETHQWGEWDGRGQALETLRDYIKEQL